jgi:hypothetical protein
MSRYIAPGRMSLSRCGKPWRRPGAGAAGRGSRTRWGGGLPMRRTAILWRQFDQAGHDSALLTESDAGAVMEGPAVSRRRRTCCRFAGQARCGRTDPGARRVAGIFGRDRGTSRPDLRTNVGINVPLPERKGIVHPRHEPGRVRHAVSGSVGTRKKPASSGARHCRVRPRRMESP